MESPSLYRQRPETGKEVHMRVSKVPVADSQKGSGGTCLCGCNELVSGYFKRGHVSTFNGKLRQAARGDDTPMRIFGRSMAMRLGPWNVKGKGQVPSKSYKDLR